MSWSRWGDGSDVYTFPSARGGECCYCSLIGDHRSFATTDLDEFLAHLAEHVESRHVVPPGLVTRVREEWAEYVGEQQQ